MHFIRRQYRHILNGSMLRIAAAVAVLLAIFADQLPSIAIAAPMLACEAPDLPLPEENENSEAEVAVVEDLSPGNSRHRHLSRYIDPTRSARNNVTTPLNESATILPTQLRSVLYAPLRC